jgi:iron(III) transport system permease protein
MTTIFALPLAVIMAKTSLRKHRWLEVVLMIPFMTPPYIGSMGWILFMQPNGYWDQFVKFPINLSEHFFNLFGMVIIMSLQVFPFLYLILKNALVKIGGSKEEAAYIHGGKSFYTFRKIILPLLLSSYALGALLVFVKAIAEFGTPATFGRRIGYYVLTTEIHQYISSWPIDFPKATSVASMLLTTCLVVWYISSIVNRRYSYNLVSGKGVREKVYKLKLWQSFLAWLYIVLILIMSIGIPYFSILVASVMKLRSGGLSIDNFTFDYYIKLLSMNSEGMKALINTLALAFEATCICVILGTILAISINKSKKLLEKVIDLFSLLPNTIPGIVMVVGLILFWNSSWMPIPIYNTYGMVVLTYVILFLPYTVQYVKANYVQLDESLFNAGKVFGGKNYYILRRITLPLLVPGMLAGWMMTFIISIRELVAALMILPPSMQTASTYIYSQFEQGKLSLGMAMAVICVIITIIMLLAINKVSGMLKLGGTIS